jgi:DNA repair protein RadC
MEPGAQGTEQCRAHNAHPHPSGVAEVSAADELITRRLKDALQLVDIRVLDHIIVAGGQVLSFAERGLL